MFVTAQHGNTATGGEVQLEPKLLLSFLEAFSLPGLPEALVHWTSNGFVLSQHAPARLDACIC